jgi:hypothetical protein
MLYLMNTLSTALLIQSFISPELRIRSNSTIISKQLPGETKRNYDEPLSVELHFRQYLQNQRQASNLLKAMFQRKPINQFLTKRKLT